MRAWLVVSPEYGEVDIIVDGQGPIEYVCDCVHVEAETRRDALLMGVALFRQQGAKYLYYYSDESPYAGVQVEALTCPSHGMPTWMGDHYECHECEALVMDLEPHK